jgi:hypothetical protein
LQQSNSTKKKKRHGQQTFLISLSADATPGHTRARGGYRPHRLAPTASRGDVCGGVRWT